MVRRHDVLGGQDNVLVERVDVALQLGECVQRLRELWISSDINVRPFNFCP